MTNAILEIPARDTAAEANLLVKDLHKARPIIYWADLFCSVCIGWTAFAAAVALPIPAAFAPAAVAMLALYRALCFIHEISHQTRRTLPGFELIWNLTTGFPLLLPSCMYVGVHSNHHRLTTYGTVHDPEYLPFAHSIRMTAVFALQSLLLPFGLMVRFFMLGPLAFFVRPLEKWLAVHFSSLSMNVRYRREITAETLRMIRYQSAGILIVWIVLVLLAGVKLFVVWYAVSAGISLINSLRTLGAHAYENEGGPISREEQLLDSIDTPAFRWGVLWAPVGLRFHALHHYFPGIPYHNLGEAYRRLSTSLPEEATMHSVRRESLAQSLEELCRRGMRENRRPEAI